MKRITVNGTAYMGNLKEEKGEVILKDAMEIVAVNRTTIAEYLKRKNTNDLETIRFSGQGTSVSISELTDEQEMIFDVCKRAMKLAKKKGEQGVVNALFDIFLGKL